MSLKVDVTTVKIINYLFSMKIGSLKASKKYKNLSNFLLRSFVNFDLDLQRTVKKSLFRD